MLAAFASAMSLPPAALAQISDDVVKIGVIVDMGGVYAANGGIGVVRAVEMVAKEVWDSVDGSKVHIIVGKTAKKLAFAARWMPGALRKQMRRRNLVE